MKILFPFLAVVTVLAFCFAPGPVRAQDVPPPPPDQGAPPPQDQSDQGASFQTFYDQLSDQGTWVQTDDYGYVFQPNVSDPDWAPYTDGHWVYTDEGWAWVSDEPWGWATYHYGRWANIDGTGWVWVPGYRWAPAWVSWRYGGGYCGWAPLPPDTFVGAEYGEPGFDAWATFHFGGDVDVSFNIGPGCYNFVRVGDMGERNYRGHFVDRSRNYEIINNTTNITNININRNGRAEGSFRGVAVGGPPINDVNAHAHQHIATVQLTASNQPGPGRLQGNSLAVYAPRVNAATIHDAKPTRVSQTIAHPTFNRGDSITKPLQVTATVKPPPPSAASIQAAETAQLHAPVKAKIATEHTPASTTLSKPLTSLTPVHETAHAPTPGVNAFTGANTVKPKTEEHTTAASPYTGEPVKPATTSGGGQGQTFHPSTTETYHPQTQGGGGQGQTFHPSTTETYHPQTQGGGGQGQTFHPSTTETYHPQTQGGGGQGQTFHPQNQPQPHPQQQGGGGGGNDKDKGHGGNTNNAPGH